MKTKKKLFYGISFLLLFIFVFLCTWNLNIAHINMWDEARHGVNAYEMLKNGNWIVTTYGGNIDYWNLKPPLSEYLIILGYKIFGLNVLGLRMYSVISMIICCIMCFIYSYKKIGKKAAIYTLICFSAATPIIFTHCTRHGDADSLFVLLYTLSIIALCLNKDNFKGIYLACLSFAFAFLAKSFHAGTIALVVLTYLVINRQLNLKNFKKILICGICACGPVLIWAIFRYSQDEINFIKTMFEYDLLSRSSTVLEDHPGGPLYYIKSIIRYCKASIIYTLFSIFGISVQKKYSKEKNQIITLIFAVLYPLIMFSLVKTKLDWYVYCIYPSIIILSAYGFQRLFDTEKSKRIKYAIATLSLIFLTICIFTNIKTVLKIKQEHYLSDVSFTLLSRNKEYSNKTVYKYLENEDETIDQDEFLALELAGDLLPKNGGYKKWLKDKESYLIVSKNTLSNIENYKVIEEKENYFLIKHKES